MKDFDEREIWGAKRPLSEAKWEVNGGSRVAEVVAMVLAVAAFFMALVLVGVMALPWVNS